MRTLLFAILFGLCATTIAEAQIIMRHPPVQVGSPDQYQKSFKEMKDQVQVTLDLEKWKGVKFRHRETRKVISFSDLSSFEQHVFVILMADRLTQQMDALDTIWEKEERIVSSPFMAGATALSKDFVIEHRKKLYGERKKFAVKYEAFAESFLKKFPDKTSDKESKEFMDKLKEYHDKEQLVDRGGE